MGVILIDDAIEIPGANLVTENMKNTRSMGSLLYNAARAYSGFGNLISYIPVSLTKELISFIGSSTKNAR